MIFMIKIIKKLFLLKNIHNLAELNQEKARKTTKHIRKWKEKT